MKTSWRLDFLEGYAQRMREEENNPELAEWIEIATSLKRKCVALERENKRLLRT